MPVFKSWIWKNPLRSLLTALTLSKIIIAEDYPLPFLNVDVAILGGGASGTYSAVRLREDYNKSILLIEKEPILGGHTNTYHIPQTGEAFNYGVQSYVDYLNAKAFFERFNISLQPSVLYSSTTLNIDPTTGLILPANASGPSFADGIPSLLKYYKVIKPWDDILLPGYWNFPSSGNDIPSDLLLPFNEFVAKYDLGNISLILSVISGQDINNKNPTLFTVRNFGSTIVEGFLNNTFFDPLPFDNSLLYSAAKKLLGDDIVVNSTIIEGYRSDDQGISLIVENSSTGKRTEVLAKRLLVATPPSLDNLAFLSLDGQEKAVLDTWAYGTVYTAVLKTNIIPDNTSITFTYPSNTTASKKKPYSFVINWNGAPGLFWLIFTSQNNLNETQGKAAILSEMETIYEGGEFPVIGGGGPKSEVVAISNHSSVSWGQTAEEIEGGFVQELYKLQGHKGTWYTGGLWCPDYSSHVWGFTDTVLPKLLEGI